MSDPLEVPRRLAIRLLHDAQIAGPRRICGLIGGRAGKAITPYPLANGATDPVRDVEPENAEQERALRHMRERGELPWAFYHSLPAAPAAPLALNGRLSAMPYQLIVSLNTKGVLDLRCWDHGEAGLRERVLQIQENT